MNLRVLLPSLLLAAKAGAVAVPTPKGLPNLRYSLHLHHELGALAAGLSTSGGSAALPSRLARPADSPEAEAARLMALRAAVEEPVKPEPEYGIWSEGGVLAQKFNMESALYASRLAIRTALKSMPESRSRSLITQARELLNSGHTDRIFDVVRERPVVHSEPAAVLSGAEAAAHFRERGYAVIPVSEGEMRGDHPALARRASRWLPGPSRVTTERTTHKPKGYFGFHEDFIDANLVFVRNPAGEPPKPGTLIADAGRLLQVPPGAAVFLTGRGLAQQFPTRIATLHAAPDSWDGERPLEFINFEVSRTLFQKARALIDDLRGREKLK